MIHASSNRDVPPVDLHAPECLEVLFVAFIALPRAVETKAVHEPFVAATPATYRDISRHVAALSEFGLRFLNGRRRSVNRKVQGSSPCPGAKFELNSRSAVRRRVACLVQQRCRNRRRIGRFLSASKAGRPSRSRQKANRSISSSRASPY